MSLPLIRFQPASFAADLAVLLAVHPSLSGSPQ
jgi:hypothetical protein